LTSTYQEFPLVKKDGKTIWIGQHLGIELTENGLQKVGLARDISDRIKAEWQEQKQIANLLVLMENLHEGVLVEDENRKITLVNRAFCDLFATTHIPEDFIGREYTNALNHIKKHFTNASKFVELEQKTVKNKAIAIAQKIELGDGRIYEIDFVPIYIETGYSGNLWKYRDVTEKHKTQVELINSKRKYKSVIDAMQLGLLEVDNDDNILKANEAFCKILGYESEEELIGKSAINTLLDEEQQQIMRTQTAGRKKGESTTYEIKAKKANGGFAWMLISGAPMYDEHENVIGSVGVHLDISYQKRISAEIEERKAMKRMMEWQDKVMDQLEDKVTVRTSELVKQKEIIEQKNKEITDSINYALLIQQALLPPVAEVQKMLADSFILYKPKDIVSGDFFYFLKNTDHACYLAAVDSTGHGVPGGFMSMLGFDKLNEAIARKKQPGDILSLFNRSIKTSFSNINEKSINDGFDISLCLLNLKTRMLHYSGANRPLWVLRKGSHEVQQIKATVAAIGGWTDDLQKFDTHQVQLKKGDTFYLFTDGFPDQYGTNNKRLLSSGFKKLLIANRNKSMEEQGVIIEHFLETWKRGVDQTDDILVIGVRL
jgi:PAS domain S-box-containing protein